MGQKGTSLEEWHRCSTTALENRLPKSRRQSVLQVSMGFYQVNESQDLIERHMPYSKREGLFLSVLLKVYLHCMGEHHAVITQLIYNLMVLYIWINLACFTSGYKVQMNEPIFLPKSKPGHAEHPEVALYSSALLTYPCLLCDIKMRLLPLEFLLPGCKVLWFCCPASQRCRGLNPLLLAQSLTLHSGAKEQLWFHGVVRFFCLFDFIFFVPKLVSTGKLQGTWHVREEATVMALDLPLCAQQGVAARP